MSNMNFKKYANVEYTEAELAEINSRIERKIFPLGDTEVSLLSFQGDKDKNIFRISQHDDCVLEYMPVFKSIDGAQQVYFWKIALNWSKGMANERVGFLVKNTMVELKELGINPFELSKAIALTDGLGIEMITGLKAIMRKQWSYDKHHLQFFKDKGCHLLVDCAGNVSSQKEYKMPSNDSTREEFKEFHNNVFADVVGMALKYEQQPVVKLLKLETANNASINKLVEDFMKKKKGGIFPKNKEVEEDLPF